MVFVIATIYVESGKREAFLEIFNRNVPNVRAEEGCIAYTPTVDVESGIPIQGPAREDVVIVVEQWESLDHLRAHLATPHMAAYQEEVADIVERVGLQVLTPA